MSVTVEHPCGYDCPNFCWINNSYHVGSCCSQICFDFCQHDCRSNNFSFNITSIWQSFETYKNDHVANQISESQLFSLSQFFNLLTTPFLSSFRNKKHRQHGFQFFFDSKKSLQVVEGYFAASTFYLPL